MEEALENERKILKLLQRMTCWTNAQNPESTTLLPRLSTIHSRQDYMCGKTQWENPVGKPHTKGLPSHGIETTTSRMEA